MPEREWDLDAFFRDVQYGCAVVKLTAGLLAASALLIAGFETVSDVSAGALLQPAGTLIAYVFALIDRSLAIL